jgi:hypothetical protein
MRPFIGKKRLRASNENVLEGLADWRQSSDTKHREAAQNGLIFLSIFLNGIAGFATIRWATADLRSLEA